jgi:hypothetical protein
LAKHGRSKQDETKQQECPRDDVFDGSNHPVFVIGTWLRMVRQGGILQRLALRMRLAVPRFRLPFALGMRRYGLAGQAMVLHKIFVYTEQKLE